ncbi:MAG: Protein-export protein SecB, partial [Alphaproteobacteria bacterium MarineAlpha9_Bin7]
RRIVADCCRDGGYPALMLEPIDFAQMYMQRKSQTREGQTRPEKTN